MGYIEEIRALVGHRPLILVAAAVLVVDDAGRVLLQHRVDRDVWGLVGGFLEPGESLEQTARREVFEETGLELGALRFLTLLDGPELYHEYPNGDQVYDVCAVYTTHQFRGPIQLQTAEVREIRFVDAQAPPQPLTMGARLALARYLALSWAPGT